MTGKSTTHDLTEGSTSDVLQRTENIIAILLQSTVPS